MKAWRSLALALGVSVFGLDIALASAHCGEAVPVVTAPDAGTLTSADPHAGHDMGSGQPSDPAPDDSSRQGMPPCCIAFGGCVVGTGLSAEVSMHDDLVVTVAIVPVTLSAPSSRGTPPDPPPPRA